MSYPQFNLTTLQLPAPASNMTKAEYKAAYGIDLDEVNIKAFKLVLLGNEKYPIDQIKSVEDGYEIYFNGRILSITDIVQTSDEVYDVANSKPLYYHPIFTQKTSGDVSYSLSFIIIDNNPTPYTMTTFKAFIDNLYTSLGQVVRMNCSGFWKNQEKTLVSVAVLARVGNKYTLVGGTTAAQSENEGTWEEIFGTPLQFIDGVNKLN